MDRSDDSSEECEYRSALRSVSERLLPSFEPTVAELQAAALACLSIPFDVDKDHDYQNTEFWDKRTVQKWGEGGGGWRCEKLEMTLEQLEGMKSLKARLGKVQAEEEEDDDELSKAYFLFPPRFDDEFILSRTARLATAPSPQLPDLRANLVRVLGDPPKRKSPLSDTAMRTMDHVPDMETALDIKLTITPDQLAFIKQASHAYKVRSTLSAAEALLQDEDKEDVNELDSYHRPPARLPLSPRIGSPPLFARSALFPRPPSAESSLVTLLRPTEPFPSSPRSRDVRQFEWNKEEGIPAPSSPAVSSSSKSPRPIWSSSQPSSMPLLEDVEVDKPIFSRKRGLPEVGDLEQLASLPLPGPRDLEEIDELESDDEQATAELAGSSAQGRLRVAFGSDEFIRNDKVKAHGDLLNSARLGRSNAPLRSFSPPLPPISLSAFAPSSTSPFALPSVPVSRSLSISLSWMPFALPPNETLKDAMIGNESTAREDELRREARAFRQRLLGEADRVEEEAVDGLVEDEEWRRWVQEGQDEDEDEALTPRNPLLGGVRNEPTADGTVGKTGPQELESGSTVAQPVVAPRDSLAPAEGPQAEPDHHELTQHSSLLVDQALDLEDDPSLELELQQPCLEPPTTRQPVAHSGTSHHKQPGTGELSFVFPSMWTMSDSPRASSSLPPSSPPPMELDDLSDDRSESVSNGPLVEELRSTALPQLGSTQDEQPIKAPIEPDAPSDVDGLAAARTLVTSQHGHPPQMTGALSTTSWSNASALHRFLGTRHPAQKKVAKTAIAPQPPKRTTQRQSPPPRHFSPPPGAIPFIQPSFLAASLTSRSASAHATRVVAFDSLLQMRPHCAALQTEGIFLVHRPSRFPCLPFITQEPHLILSGTSCVLFHKLTDLLRSSSGPSSAQAPTRRPEAVFTALRRLARRFDRILLVLEEQQVRAGSLRAYSYTPPVLGGLHQLAQALQWMAKSEEREAECLVEVVLSKGPAQSAQLTGTLVRYLRGQEQQKVGRGGVRVWGERRWLMDDPSEDELTLLQLDEMNELSASAILGTCTLYDFLALSSDDRHSTFSGVCGSDRINRISAIIAANKQRPDGDPTSSSPPRPFLSLSQISQDGRSSDKVFDEYFDYEGYSQEAGEGV
ncbi:hypothetical protein JCM1841_005793 [Sporobolomyces salmonicolor]